MKRQPLAGPCQPVVLGRVHGLFGVRGWVKVYSYTQPIESLFEYPRWWLGAPGKYHLYSPLEARHRGKSLVARLADACGNPLPDRDAAAALLGLDIAVEREDMPDPDPGEYYWFDLIGLEVVTVQGQTLGQITSMMETGAHDVLVISSGAHEYLIPMVIDEFVKSVDLDVGRMLVDWDPEF